VLRFRFNNVDIASRNYKYCADRDGMQIFQIGLATVLNAFRDRDLMSVFTVIKIIGLLYTVRICSTLIDSWQNWEII